MPLVVPVVAAVPLVSDPVVDWAKQGIESAVASAIVQVVRAESM